MNYIFPIALGLILIILILRFCNKTNDKNLKYKICQDYFNRENHIFTKILEDNNFTRTDNSDWTFYFPCGYNLNEYELFKLNADLTKTYKNRYIFAINGSDQIVGKIKLWNHMINFYKRDIVTQVIPESYDFNSNKQKILFQKNYKKNNIYVIKSKMQKQLGINITDNLEIIKKNFNIKNILVQHFITNQLLINNYHFNIRVFIIVKFYKRNMEVYLYNEGNIRYAAKPFNENKLDNSTLITKGVSAKKEIYDKNPLTISDLKLYLAKKGIKYNQINESIKNAIILIFNCLYSKIGNFKRIQEAINFQLFGGDFMVTKDLHTYFLEFNKGPELGCVKGLNQECKMKQTLQKDILKLIGLNKSNFNSPYKFEKIFSKSK
jgi:hypothetical protein